MKALSIHSADKLGAWSLVLRAIFLKAQRLELKAVICTFAIYSLMKGAPYHCGHSNTKLGQVQKIQGNVTILSMHIIYLFTIHYSLPLKTKYLVPLGTTI